MDVEILFVNLCLEIRTGEAAVLSQFASICILPSFTPEMRPITLLLRSHKSKSLAATSSNLCLTWEIAYLNGFATNYEILTGKRFRLETNNIAKKEDFLGCNSIHRTRESVCRQHNFSIEASKDIKNVLHTDQCTN